MVRYEQAHKTSAFGTAVANALSLLEAAAYNAQAGDLNEAETLVGAAWAIIRGDDESASTYGCTVLSNADLRSEYFGVPGDVTEPLVAAFQSALSDLNADTTEALFLEAARAAIVTNLRSAIRYASRMDEAAAAGEADLVRESQFEGLTYLRVIAPLVAALDPESAAAIEAAFTQGADSGVGQFDLSGDPILDDVVQAAERILEAAGVDVGSFGTYTENEPISG